MPENPFVDWANRLILGPRALVQQQLADEAAAERATAGEAEWTRRFGLESAQRQREAEASRAGGRENILLQIREQARANQETEERAAQERLTLAREALDLGLPEEEPTFRRDPRELLRYKGGLETMKALTPKPPTPHPLTQRDPTKPMVDPFTGVEVQPATKEKPEKPWYEGLQPLEAFGLLEDLRAKKSEQGLSPAEDRQLKMVERQLGGTPSPGGVSPLTGGYVGFQRDIAFGRGAGAESGKRSLPIKDRRDWVNMRAIANPQLREPIHPPAGMPEDAVLASGTYTQIGDEERKALGALQTAEGVTGPLFKLARDIITAETPMQIGRQMVRWAGTYVPWASVSVQAEKTYRDSLEAFLSNLARAFGGEKGVLTNLDRDKIKNAFPWFTDTVSIREAKIAIIEQVMANARQAQLQSIFMDLPPTTEYTQTKENLFKALTGLGTRVRPKTQGPKPVEEVLVPR